MLLLFEDFNRSSNSISSTATAGTSASFLEQLQLLSNISNNNDIQTEINSDELKTRLNYYMTDKKVFKDHKYYKKRDDNNRPFLLTINDIFTSSINMKATKALLSLAKISNESSDLTFSSDSKHENSDNIDYFFRSGPLDLSKNGMDNENDSNGNNLKLTNITCVKTPVVLSSMSSNTATITPISLLEPKVEITCDSDLLQN